jgi:membrane-associated protein
MTAAEVTGAGPAGQPPPAPSPPLSAAGRSARRLDMTCVAGIVLGYALYYLAVGLTPSLLGHDPQVLELLDGSTAGAVSAGAFARIGRLPLLVATTSPLLPMLTSDVFYWWAGRRFGERALAYWSRNSPRRARWVARTERLVARYGVVAVALEYYLPVPTSLIQLLAGSSDMPLATFLLADLVGTLLWFGPLVGLGYALGRPAVRVAGEITHYSLLATLGLVGLLVALGIARYWRSRREEEPQPAG